MKKNADVLIDFLNAIFEDSDEPLVETVEILNPFIEKDALSDKMSVLDIRARTQDRTLINIEIQIRDEHNMRERTLYYWSKLYEGQLAEGDPYHQLHKAISVNILNFREIENDRYHNVFHLREDTDGRLLTDQLEIHFLELSKLRDHPVAVDRSLIRWLTFLSARTKDHMVELVKGYPAMEKAMTTLEFLSQDQQTRMLYEARQKALHDYASAIGSAKLETAKAIARGLLESGVDLEIIMKTTELSKVQIEELRQGPH